MNRFARLRSGPFRLLMVFALIAMAIRAAVPVGFMLAPEHGRWVAVTMCSGSGLTQMALNLDTGEHRNGDAPAEHDEDAAVHHAACVFATVANLAPPVAGAALSLPLTAVADAAPSLSPSVGIGRGLAAPPPWATGPPAQL
jgi:hypothetical protein